jgi:hypothetical protein
VSINQRTIYVPSQAISDQLRNYLAANGDAAAKKLSKKSSASRDDLVSAANSAYTSASSAGGTTYASMTSYLTQATASAKKGSFDTWSESELKSYLDSYGIVSHPKCEIKRL